MKADESYFLSPHLLPPPPPPPPAQWGHPGNCHEQFYSSPACEEESIHNITRLVDLEKKMCEVWPLGALPLAGPPSGPRAPFEEI